MRRGSLVVQTSLNASRLAPGGIKPSGHVLHHCFRGTQGQSCTGTWGLKGRGVAREILGTQLPGSGVVSL